MEKLIEDYISKADWRINENANTSFSGSGMKSYVASTILAKYSLAKFPEKIRKAHKEGAIHIHDLDGGIMTPYCISGSTGIQTPTGWKFAKNVKIGDTLIGYNENSGRFEHTKVEKIFCRETEEIYKLRLKRSDNVDVNLKITGNHKVLTNKGWLSVEELNIGDEILYLTQSRRESSKQNKIEILKVKKEKLPKSKLTKKNHSSEYSRKTASLTLKKMWEEHKDEIMKKRYSSGFYDKISKYMKKNNPMFNKESAKKGGIKRREYYKNNPECHPNKKMAKKLFISKPQLKLFALIKLLYNDVELEYPIITNKTIRFADVAVPSQNIIFEYNGKYWHKNIKKDEEREKELKEQGWQVFNFNNENELNIDNIKKYIIPENGAIVVSKELLKSKSVGKRKYKFKVYNFHCSPHENYLANSMIVHNCYGADLQQLMLEGLKNPVGSCSTPAKHFDTIVDHMVNYLYISQSEFNGAQAFSNVDTLLAPYIIGQDYKYVIQNIQRLIYNISYPLRSSFQTPFINFSFDLIPPKHMANEPVIIGGKVSENMVYGDLQKEMDLINECFLELMIKGDSMGKPFTFPIPTYGITKDIMNKNDDVTKLLYTLAAKFGSPNFQNYIKSGNDPSDVRSMCCRLRLDIAKLKSRGLWNIGNKTGSLGVCTINLNHATKDGTENFMENVDNAYELSVEELAIKREHVEDAFKKGLFPFTKQYLPSFKTFFNTVGIHAMNEACLSMFESSIEENQSFVVRTLRYLRKRVDETTEETGILHNLEESPAEGATYRLAKLDRKLGLPVQGGEHPYLTNSTHCPVNTKASWVENLRIQERFKPFYSGGTIVHGFIGEEMSPRSAEYLIKQISLNTTIPYYNLTPLFSHCNTHGHMLGNIELCPKCGKENLVYSRVVGYIQPYQKWNDGKKSEFKDRKMYKM